MQRILCHVVFLNLVLVGAVNADVTAPEATEVRSRPWSTFRPYVPEKIDYALELGSMWEENNLYWLGGQVGWHIGRCMFSFSQSCQQYFDIFGGAGGRDGHTNGLSMASLRWQFVDLGDRFVPSARIFAGVVNIRDENRDGNQFGYGVGYGFTTSLHPRMDLQFEVRVGGADRIWSQSLMSMHFKIDKWVDYFADKIQSIGAETAAQTGRVIKKSVGAPVDVMQWIGEKVRGSEKAPTD